ncbi:MAG TPA: dihydroxyacetone kinase [Firmicutes bacterium]|nr:dihydroxyacetone kinase [Bacillota bacterium]
MISVLLVSHSKQITDGLKSMIDQMINGSKAVLIVSLGGTEDGGLGTDPMKILNAIKESADSKWILIFCDIGSSIMSTTSALDLLDDDELKAKVRCVDAPLVEGAFAAGVIATTTDDINDIISQVDDAKTQKKFD